MKTTSQGKIGFFKLLADAFRELARNPLLFLPKFISVTIYAMIYAFVISETKAVFMTGLITPGYFIWNFVALLFIPLWILIDGMYPPLVEQGMARGGRLDFWEALKVSFSKFWGVFFMIMALLVVLTIASLPFLILIATALVSGDVPLIAFGAACILAIMLAMVIGAYFVPTSILMGKGSFIDAVSDGFGATAKNLKLVTALSVFSLAVLVAGFAIGGLFETLGIAGFIAARYFGGVIAVYLYVVNPAAYIEVRKNQRTRS